MRLAWADVRLDEAEFGGPSIVAQASRFRNLDQSTITGWLVTGGVPDAAQSPSPRQKAAALRVQEWRDERPRLLSLTGANVATSPWSGWTYALFGSPVPTTSTSL